MPVWVVRRPKQRYWLHALLLAITLFTTLVVGSGMQSNFLRGLPPLTPGDSLIPFFPIEQVLHHPAQMLLGIPFSATVMLILLSHEMGHYLYCRYYQVDATLPFFIPFPSFIGTMGAFIRIRSPIRSRRALFDIGIAGPIAGFVVAMVVLVVSLCVSHAMPGWSDQPPTADALPEIVLRYPLIFHFVHRVLGAIYPAYPLAEVPLGEAALHPTAIAAWVGMFATSLNLLPGGQLDGGHIVFSIIPRAHKFISRIVILILVPMAVYLWSGWLIWALLLEISSMRHPNVADFPKVSGVRLGLAAFALVMLILTMTPAPFLHASLRETVHQIRGH